MKGLKNEWLYELGEEQEVVTIPYNYLECGGDVLLPGTVSVYGYAMKATPLLHCP